MKKDLAVYIASPRGFCAGVERAIKIVELSLKKYRPPVYVRHEIVHNRYVVQDLEKKGAIFVEELDEVPEGAPVVFSAHGVPKVVFKNAQDKKMTVLDATCPLVFKVHREAEVHAKKGAHVLLIGHAGHPEVIGTMGQLQPDQITLIETTDDVAKISPPEGKPLAYVTQTTLSVDDTAEIIDTLRKRFPDIHGPRREDICYATTNRQAAVKLLIEHCTMILVVGAPNSSNSLRLVELAIRNNIAAKLVQNVSEIDWSLVDSHNAIGITAGASAPEVLVEEIILALQDRYTCTIETIHSGIAEEITFKLPQQLTAAKKSVA